MKKITYLSLLAISMSMAISCKNNEATSTKIDFTQSYENAALALTSAQNHFNEALATNDISKINVAKKELQTATSNYLASKNSLIQHGGTIKQQYESNLVQSQQTLANVATVTSPGSTTANNSDSAIGGKVGQTLEKESQKLGKIGGDIHNTTTKSLDNASATIEKISAKKTKAQQDIQSTRNQAEKNFKETSEKTKKLKDDISSLFKKD